MNQWKSKFGDEYTERNGCSVHELDQEYKELYGLTRTDLLKDFLKKRKIETVFEAGCNIGTQLMAVKQIIPHAAIYGMDLNRKALDIAEYRGVRCVQGDITETPLLLSENFDLVMHNGVLIHVEKHEVAFKNLVRLTKPGGLIIGLEYWAESFERIEYRDGVFMQRGPFERLGREHEGGITNLKYLKRNDDKIDVFYCWQKGRKK